MGACPTGPFKRNQLSERRLLILASRAPTARTKEAHMRMHVRYNKCVFLILGVFLHLAFISVKKLSEIQCIHSISLRLQITESRSIGRSLPMWEYLGSVGYRVSHIKAAFAHFRLLGSNHTVVTPLPEIPPSRQVSSITVFSSSSD